MTAGAVMSRNHGHPAGEEITNPATLRTSNKRLSFKRRMSETELGTARGIILTKEREERGQRRGERGQGREKGR